MVASGSPKEAARWLELISISIAYAATPEEIEAATKAQDSEWKLKELALKVEKGN